MCFRLWTVSFTLLTVLKGFSCISIPNDITRCDTTSVIDGKFLSENLENAKLSLTLKNYQLQLNVNKTICISANVPDYDNDTNNVDSINGSKTGTNTTLLYTLRYLGMRQVYPISSEYVFGIPQFESQCKCDCPGGDEHCSTGDGFKNCRVSNGICVKSEHYHQRSVGCPNAVGGEAKLCCEIVVTPYNNLTFNAVYLDQPSFDGQFLLKVYVHQGEQWDLRNEETISVSQILSSIYFLQYIFLFQVSLNSDQHKDFRGVQLTIKGTPSNTVLSPDMYFYSNDKSTSSQLQSGKRIPINKLYDWSTNHIGWFRLLNDTWMLNDHLAKLPNSHKVSVSNCMEQKYSISYSNVQYYCIKNKTRISCNKDADMTNSEYSIAQNWISRIVLPHQENGVERQIIVEMGQKSPSIGVTLNMDSRIELRFLHHESDVKDFSALIVLDKRSNKFLRITYVGAKGTVTGIVYSSDANRVFSSEIVNDDKQSALLKNFTDTISLSPEIRSSKNVCIRPYGKPKKEICKLIEYHSIPLEFVYEKNEWMPYTGDCPGCNEFTLNNILKYLDPRQWFNNVTSIGDLFSRLVDVAFYFVLFILILFVCRRCFCPFLKVLLCSSTSSHGKKQLAP